MDRILEAEIRAARAAGFPMSAAELHAYHTPGTHDGYAARDAYLEAFDLLVRDEALELKLGMGRGLVNRPLPPRGAPWPADQLDAARAYLALNEEAIAKLVEASRMGPAWFNFTNSQYQLEPGGEEFGRIHPASQLLALQAAWQGQAGEAASAVETVEHLCRVSLALADEPVMISHVVRISILAVASEVTERLLSTVELTDGQLARVHQAIKSARDEARGLVRALAGERASCIARLRGETIDTNAQRDAAAMFAWRASTLYQRDLLHYLHGMETAINLARMPQLSTAKLDETDEHELPSYAVFSAIELPVVGVFLRTDLWGRARYDVAVVGVAAARYSRANGRLPDTLDDLVPTFLDAVPSDPFSEGPLRYRVTQRGAIVYSLGRSETDHGGRELSIEGARNDRNGANITFTLGDAQADLWPEQWPEVATHATDTAGP